MIVSALAVDGSHVYLGGGFTQVGAQVYNGGLARVSATGAGAVDTAGFRSRPTRTTTVAVPTRWRSTAGMFTLAG